MMIRSRVACFAGLVLLPSVVAAETPPTGKGAPAPSTVKVSPAPAPAPASAPTPYSGHGAATLSPEVLARYRPLPLDSDASRHIQSMMDIRGPGIGEVAPDGKSLYFSWTVTGVSQIWKIDGPLRFPVQLTGGEDSTSLAGITPDGKWLLVSRDRKGEENPGLYLQSPEGGPLLVIQHAPGIQTELQHISDDGRTLYFHSNDIARDSYAIYRYDLASRKRELVFDTPGLWSVADLRSDGHLLLSRATGSLTAELFDYEPVTKKLVPLLGQNEKEEYEALYGAGTNRLIVQTNKLGEFRRLYSFEWGSGESSGKLTPITPEMKHNVVGFSIDRTRTRLFYSVNSDGYTRVHLVDARTFKPIATPKALDDGDHTFLGRTTPDGRYTTLGIDDGSHPLRAVVYDARTGKLTQWHKASAPELDTLRFPRAVLESYPARDGTPIPVWVRRSSQCTDKPCPVIVHFHGGPESQTLPGFSVGAQIFVDAGFVFVEPNVRGSEGYGKQWLHADDGPRRLDVITDIEDAGTWARKRFTVGGSVPRVGIYGGSYGGYSVLMGMTMFGGTFDAGVDVVGISSLATFLRNTAPYRRILRTSEYGDPDKDAAALEKLSPMSYLDRIRAPLLIFQGASDPRVPVGEAIQIHEAAVKKGLASQLMIFPDEGHGAQKRDNRVLTAGHTLAFFQRHLQPPAAATAPSPPHSR